MAGGIEYDKRQVDAAHAVMLELMRILADFHDAMVVVGGWTPYLQISDRHIGSMDVDLLLNAGRIARRSGPSIGQRLQEEGYRRDPKIYYRWLREVSIDAGPPVVVPVDFLAQPEKEGGRERIAIQDIESFAAGGGALALAHAKPVRVEGMLPDRSTEAGDVNVCMVVPFLVMKGLALGARSVAKDSYDIYFCAKYYQGGPRRLGKAFGPYIKRTEVQDAFRAIRQAFSSVSHRGPADVVTMLNPAEREERESLRRDAYEQVYALLTTIAALH